MSTPSLSASCWEQKNVFAARTDNMKDGERLFNTHVLFFELQPFNTFANVFHPDVCGGLPSALVDKGTVQMHPLYCCYAALSYIRMLNAYMAFNEYIRCHLHCLEVLRRMHALQETHLCM